MNKKSPVEDRRGQRREENALETKVRNQKYEEESGEFEDGSQ